MRRKYNKRVHVGTAQWWAGKTRLDEETGCVLYTGFTNKQGYSLVNQRPGNRKILVHRLAYEQVNGPIPEGHVICHRCDTPNCVNPSHLFAGTQKDNLRDMFAKGRGRPQGRATPALTDFPAVSARVNAALAKTLRREEWLTDCQNTSYTPCRDAVAMSGSWLPPVEPTERQQIRAILLGHRPRLRAAEPAPERLLTVATPASCCQPSRVSLPGDRT